VADELDTLAAAVMARPWLINTETGRAIPHDVGKLEVEQFESYPRVVWVSEGGDIESTDDVGARVDPATGTTTRQRQVRTDVMAVQLHIWAACREDCRNLMHALIFTLWEQAYGSVEFGSYRWITEELPRAEWATYGVKILLDLNVRVPINEAAGGLTTLTAQAHTADFVSDLDGSTEQICP
jgi:hypothetical protein